MNSEKENKFVVLGISPIGESVMMDEKTLLDFLLNSKNVCFSMERDVDKEWVPPYGPRDFQLHPGKQSYYVEFDDKISYILDGKSFVKLFKKYNEIKKEE